MSDIQDDHALIVFFSAGCSLDSSPGTNWVENNGGLPNYICKLAKGIMKSGKSKSSAIAIAVSRVKVWSAGGDDVDADTKAKAVKAVAEWTALKAKNKSKKLVKATSVQGREIVMLSNLGVFNTEMVRRAWNDLESKLSSEFWKANPAYSPPYSSDSPEQVHDRPHYDYSYIQELWTDHIFVAYENNVGPTGGKFANVPYSVNGDQVTFGTPQILEQVLVEVPSDYEELTASEILLLGDVLGRSTISYLDRISDLLNKN